MAATKDYKVVRYNERRDGTLKVTGVESKTMTAAEAEELSYMAIVVTGYSFNGNPICLTCGKHAEFDPHLGWVS